MSTDTRPKGRHRAAPAGDALAPVVLTAKGVYAMREPVAPHRLALAIYPTRTDGTCNSEDLIWVNIEPQAVLQLRDRTEPARRRRRHRTAGPQRRCRAGQSGRCPVMTALDDVRFTGDHRMTGPEHYEQAQKLAMWAEEARQVSHFDDAGFLSNMATSHATLALAAATALVAVRQDADPTAHRRFSDQVAEWERVLS